ncbi:MAG: FG-GAP repeat domain-containing protein, partial [Verrucomicrobiales bacterium]
PDLYVANDFGRNNFYRNDSGRFTDIAAKVGIEDLSAGMSVSWGDYNQDGLMDLYVGNMFSSAGNRVAYQRQYRSKLNPSAHQAFRRHARGNTLFENRGDGTFRDVTLPARVNMGRWSWSSNFVDVNNDSHEDLLVANGMVTSDDDTGDL